MQSADLFPDYVLQLVRVLWWKIDEERAAIHDSSRERDRGMDKAFERSLSLISEYFRHTHKAGPGDVCPRCGLHLYHDIHVRLPK